MNKEIISIALALGCVSSIAATNNYDLLGRKGSKMNSPMVYKNVDYSKFKKKEQEKLGSSLEAKALAKQASGIKSGAKAIVGGFTPKGYGFTNCSNKTSGCGESLGVGYGSLDWPTYQTKVNNEFIKIISHEKPRFSPDFDFVNAGPSRSYLNGFEGYEYPYNVYGNVTYTSSFNKNLQITYSPVASIMDDLNVDKKFWLNKTNVGVYLDEEAVPVRLDPYANEFAPFILADNASIDDFNTMPGYEMRASRMYELVHNFSERSAVYAVKGQPLNPAETTKGPQIYMGLHAYGGTANSSYSTKAKNLDNYIYNNRTVEIVGAGNTAGNLSAKAFAVNAITVGALDPVTKKTASYSAKNLPKYCGSCGTYRKPDIENYSNFYTDDWYRKYSRVDGQTYEYYPYYDGTEAAAGVTAGMISSMLSYNEFYKWHPEVVNAVIQNAFVYASRRNPINYDDILFDQMDELNLHHSYYFIGDVNTLMKTYNSNVDKNGEIPYLLGKKEIRLSFDIGSLVRGTRFSYNDLDGFEVSIAWLNSGNDVANLGGLPQKFELLTYGHAGTASGMNLQYSSTWDDNLKNSPYRRALVDGFGNKANRYFVIRIVLDEEDPRSENYGQMVLGLDIHPILK